MNPSLRRGRGTLLLAALVGSACACEGPKPPRPPAASSRSGGGAKHPDVPLTAVPAAPQVQAPPPEPKTEAAPLAVVVARPTGELFSEARPTITFSKPVMAVGTVEHEQAQAPVASITPPLAGEWKWLGSASVEFVPKGLVPYATTFQVQVAAGLVALDGTKLAAPYSFSFTTPRPDLQGEVPSAGFRWLKPDAVFTLVINQPVQELAKHVRLVAGGKEIAVAVAAEVNIEDERRAKEKERRYAREDDQRTGFRNRQTRYELKPVSPLPLDVDVSLTVLGTLQGKEGALSLGKDQVFPYRTYGALRLEAVQACSLAPCSYGPLLVRTTNRVDIASLKRKVKVTPAVAIDWDRVEEAFGGYGFDEKGGWQGSPYFSLPGRYVPGTHYSLELAAGVQD